MVLVRQRGTEQFRHGNDAVSQGKTLENTEKSNASNVHLRRFAGR